MFLREELDRIFQSWIWVSCLISLFQIFPDHPLNGCPDIASNYQYRHIHSYQYPKGSCGRHDIHFYDHNSPLEMPVKIVIIRELMRKVVLTYLRVQSKRTIDAAKKMYKQSTS